MLRVTNVCEHPGLRPLSAEELGCVAGGTPSGDACRAGYAGFGALYGALLTSESFGWGAIVGGMAGGWYGARVCQA